MQVLRGAAIAVIMGLLAPLIAAFFDAPESVAVIRWVGFSVLIRGFTNIAVIYFVKELRFGGYFLLQMSDKAANIIVSITAAIVLRNVWALVLGVLAGTMVQRGYFIHHPDVPTTFRMGMGQGEEPVRLRQVDPVVQPPHLSHGQYR